MGFESGFPQQQLIVWQLRYLGRLLAFFFLVLEQNLLGFLLFLSLWPIPALGISQESGASRG